MAVVLSAVESIRRSCCPKSCLCLHAAVAGWNEACVDFVRLESHEDQIPIDTDKGAGDQIN